MEKYIDLPQGSVFYKWIPNMKKDAQTMVFTHGLCTNHTMFDDEVRFFSKQYNILVWDVPSHGYSRPFQNFSYKIAAKALNEIIRKEGVEKIILIGMSMGGYISQQFVSLYPQKVIGMVALDTTPLDCKYYSTLDLKLLSLLISFSKKLNDRQLKHHMANIISVDKVSYEKMLYMLEDITKDEIHTLIDVAFTELADPVFSQVFEIPILILIGRKDKTRRMKKFCRKWVKREKHTMIFIDNAAHFSHSDNPQAVHKAIKVFLSKL